MAFVIADSISKLSIRGCLDALRVLGWGGVLNIYNPKFERTTYLLKIVSRGSQKARPDEGLRAALADKAERGGGDAQYLKTKTTWIITRTHHYHDRFMFRKFHLTNVGRIDRISK